MNINSARSMISSTTTKISFPSFKSTNRSHPINLNVSSPGRNNASANFISCCFKQKKTPEIHAFGFPISLRIIKMKRNLANGSSETLPLSLDMSVIKSVSALLLTHEEFLKFKYKEDLGENSVGIARDMSVSFILLIKKLFFQSPNLFYEVLSFIADLFVFSVENYLPKNTIDLTQIMYEISIFNGPEDSLMLCNYGKFLYQIADDNERAEEMLKRAVQVKPVDGEALYQYGMFMWLKRVDVDAAEELFIAAIRAEPENPYYRGAYAEFLLSSGSPDTCYTNG